LPKGICSKESRIILLIPSFIRILLRLIINEADTEQEEDEYLWEIHPLVTSIDKLDFDTIGNVES